MDALYKIIARYTTGGSLDSERTQDEVTSHNDLAAAKENLQRIKEHYAFWKAMNQERRTFKEKRELIMQLKDKPWFVNVPKLWVISENYVIDEKYRHRFKPENLAYFPDATRAEGAIILRTDDGVANLRIGAFWCGYFETLHEVEVIFNDPELKVSFD